MWVMRKDEKQDDQWFLDRNMEFCSTCGRFRALDLRSSIEGPDGETVYLCVGNDDHLISLEVYSTEISLDDRGVLLSPVCGDCKHADLLGGRKCAAFPDGIPLNIWCGNMRHDESVGIDHGIVFTKATEEDYEARRAACEAAKPEIDAAFERNFPGQLKSFNAMLDYAVGISNYEYPIGRGFLDFHDPRAQPPE